MSKIISHTIKLLLLLISSHCFSQTETFDIATYTPPKDWKKSAGTGSVVYTSVNTATGTFCILAMYAYTKSLGDAQKDFKSEWKDRVATVHNAEADPKTEVQSRDGWKVITGAAPIKVEGSDAYAILAVYSGYGKKFSALTILNDQSYINGIDSFLKGMELDKKAMVAIPQTSVSGMTGMKQQFGTVIYTIPDNWNVKKYPDGDILTPTDIPKGEFLEIWVHPSMSFSGTIEQALKKSYDETVTKLQAGKMNDVNGGNYSAQTAKKSFHGWEYIRCSGGIHLGGGEYPREYGLDLLLVKTNDRYEQVSIVKSRNNCSYSTYYPSDRVSYNNDIENFLFSLTFPDWKEQEIKTGITKSDGIIGCWQGISMSVGAPKPGADLGAELKGKQLIFFSNGQAFFGNNFPAGGLDELNTWIRAENNRRDWGTYTFSNGRGILKLPYADIPLRMENGRFIITTNKTDHGFIKLNPVEGARFNGTYALSSKNFLGQETGKTLLIRFTTDGKFEDKGALGVLSHSYVDCVNMAKEPGSGTYEVKNYSVIFNYTDGRKIRIAFMGKEYDKKDPSPATIVLSFNEDVLRKQ